MQPLPVFPVSPLSSVIEGFPAASPDLLARRDLLRRTDSKYLVSVDRLADLIAAVAGHYAVLRVASEALMTYRSLYFDTAALDCFEDHRRGRRVRHKVRVRHYPDREVSFLELKTRRSDLVTQKRRLKMAYDDNTLGSRELGFLAGHCRLPVDALVPQIWTHCRRVSLLGLHTSERVTIDVDLAFARGNRRIELDGVAILEVKQSPLCRATPVMEAVRAAHLRPISVSKYCSALAMLDAGVRTNRFRPALRAVEKMNS